MGCNDRGDEPLDGFFRFRCFVPEKGYRLVSAIPDRSEEPDIGDSFVTALIPNQDEGGASKDIVYDPLTKKNALLFREFAGIDGVDESILRFANRYGALGGSAAREVEFLPDGNDPVRGPYAFARGEDLSTWRYEIREMKKAVEFWDLIQRNNPDEILILAQQIAHQYSAYIQRTEGGKCPLGYPLSDFGLTQLIRLDLHRIPEFSRWHKEILKQETQVAVKAGPARFLERLLWGAINWDLHGLVDYRIGYDAKFSKAQLEGEPTCLLGALWLQLAHAATRGITLGKCNACGKVYDVHPTIARSDKKFCSEQCRIRAYRQRISEAKQLAAAGHSIEDIALQLRTDQATVRRWVSYRRKGDGK